MITQKEIPLDNNDGLHFIYGHPERLHIDYPSRNGVKQEDIDNVIFFGSTCVVSGENTILKTIDEDFVYMPIRNTPQQLDKQDFGSHVIITADSRGKIFFARVKRE